MAPKKYRSEAFGGADHYPQTLVGILSDFDSIPRPRSFYNSLRPSAQKRFQGAMQACPAVGMVPHTFEGVYGRDMVSTDHMQKARVRKFHTIAYGGQTVSAVSGSVVENRAYGGHFLLASNSTR